MTLSVDAQPDAGAKDPTSVPLLCPCISPPRRADRPNQGALSGSWLVHSPMMQVPRWAAEAASRWRAADPCCPHRMSPQWLRHLLASSRTSTTLLLCSTPSCFLQPVLVPECG